MVQPTSIGILIMNLGHIIEDKYAMQALCDMGEVAAPELMAALEDKNWFAACRAAIILGMMKYEPAVPKIEKLLYHDCMDVMKDAAKALGKMGGKDAFDALVRFLDKEGNDSKKFHFAGLALMKYGRRAVPELIRITETKPALLASRDIKGTLIHISDPDAVPELVAGMKSSNIGTAEVCSEVLEIIGWAAIPQIMKEIRKPDNVSLRGDLLRTVMMIVENSTRGKNRIMKQDLRIEDLGLKQSFVRRNAAGGAGAHRAPGNAKRAALFA